MPQAPLLALDRLAALGEPLRIDLPYADAAHPENLFGCRIYHPRARAWLRPDLTLVLILAARLLQRRQGWRLVVLDALRTVEAQALMLDSPMIRAHPEIVTGTPPLLSRPGGGAHPRGAAVDLRPETAEGAAVWMGTGFDAFERGPEGPLASRHLRRFSADPAADARAVANRDALEAAMREGAGLAGVPLWPLPDEWWDFRLPPAMTAGLEPLTEAAVPPACRMVEEPAPGDAEAEDAALRPVLEQADRLVPPIRGAAA